MNAYGYKVNTRAKKNTSAISTAIRFMRAVFSVLGERISAVGLRIASVIAGFIVTLGIVGGMECGSVPIYIGLPVCLILTVAALLTHFDD